MLMRPPTEDSVRPPLTSVRSPPPYSTSLVKSLRNSRISLIRSPAQKLLSEVMGDVWVGWSSKSSVYRCLPITSNNFGGVTQLESHALPPSLHNNKHCGFICVVIMAIRAYGSSMGVI